LVTPDDFDVQSDNRKEVKPIERIKEKLVPPTRIERAARGLGNRCSIQLSYGGNNDNHSKCLNNVGGHETGFTINGTV
jgi:hypothetical protein